MSNRLPILLGFLILFTSACKKNAVPVSTSAPKKINKLNVHNLDFNNFTAKGRLQVEEAKGNKISSGFTLRVQKDSIIWISVVPALGIEAARVKITRDSVYMVNRLQKEYFAGDYSVIKQKYKVSINYDLLQAMLLGNYLPGSPETEKIVIESPLQHSRQQRDNFLIDQFLDASNFKLKKLTIKDQPSNNTITVDYSQFEQVGDKPFAKTALIVVQPDKAPKGTSATLDYNKISVNEGSLSFPFSIPPGYTRK